MRLSRRRLLRLAGATALTWGLPRRLGRGQDAVVVGHQAPLTGAFAAFGTWHNRALLAAVEKLNAEGGLNGRPLRLVTRDSASDADAARRAFNDLALEEGAAFIVGSVNSAANLASAALAREAKVLYFPMGVATPITARAGNRYVFKSYHTTLAAIRAAAPWALANWGRRWTILASGLEFAQAQAADWTAQIEALGGKVVQRIDVPPFPQDFFPFLSKVDPDATEAVFQAFTAVDTVRFFAQAEELGLTGRLPFFGLIEGIDVLDVALPGFAGSAYVSSTPRRADQVPPERRAFDAAYRQALRISPEGFSLEDPDQVVPLADLFGAWEALHWIRRAAALAGWQDRTDHPALIEALEGLSVAAGEDFPQGDKTIRAQDHQAFHAHVIERVEDGQLWVVERLPLEASLYEVEVDYTAEAF